MSQEFAQFADLICLGEVDLGWLPVSQLHGREGVQVNQAMLIEQEPIIVPATFVIRSKRHRAAIGRPLGTGVIGAAFCKVVDQPATDIGEVDILIPPAV